MHTKFKSSNMKPYSKQKRIVSLLLAVSLFIGLLPAGAVYAIHTQNAGAIADIVDTADGAEIADGVADIDEGDEMAGEAVGIAEGATEGGDAGAIDDSGDGAIVREGDGEVSTEGDDVVPTEGDGAAGATEGDGDGAAGATESKGDGDGAIDNEGYGIGAIENKSDGIGANENESDEAGAIENESDGDGVVEVIDVYTGGLDIAGADFAGEESATSSDEMLDNDELGGAVLAPGDMYVVKFIVEGETLYSTYVAEGANALYPGAPPADKFPPSAVSFLGWYETGAPDDAPHDFLTPIMGNLDLHARFSELYLVQFLDGYGDVYVSARVAQGGYAVPPPPAQIDAMPMPQDKHFSYWSLNEAAPYAPYEFGAAPLTSDMVFHAILTDKIYVYYVSYSSEIQPNILKPGDKATKPATDPTRQNYDFQYWTTSPSGSGAAYDFSTPVYADLVLYAHWTGTPNSVSYKIVWWIETSDLLYDPIPGNAAHYDFAYSEIVGGATPGEVVTINTLPDYLTGGSPVNPADPLLYAEFQYSAPTMISAANNTIINVFLTRKIYRITFALGSTGRWLQFYNSSNRYYGSEYYIDAKYEQDLTEIWPCMMTATFSTMQVGDANLPFNCWDVPESVNTQQESMAIQWLTRRNVMSTDMMPKDPSAAGYVLDAVYFKTDAYRVRYWIEPYAGQTGAVTRTFEGKAYILDDQYSQDNVPDLNAKAINGLKNVGYDFSDSETGPAYVGGNLYQNFYYDRNRNDLIYDMGGAPPAIQLPAVGNIMFGQPLAAYYASPAAWDNYVFKGWYKDSDKTLEFDFAAAEMSANTNLTVFAKWESLDHTVTFKDGNAVLGSQGVANAEPVNFNNLTFGGVTYELGLNIPSKGDFIGWLYYPAGVNVLTPYPIDLLVYNDFTLYANWQTGGFQVIYNMGDADPAYSAPPTDPQTYSIGTYARALGGAMIAPAAGQTFIGWRVNGAGAITYYPDSFIPITGTMQMYPHFVDGGELTTITFDNNYPASPEQQIRSVVQNTDVPLPDGTIFSAVPPGFSFIGWQTLPGGGGGGGSGGSGGGTFYAAHSLYKIGAGPAILYAVWSDGNVKLTYNGNNDDAATLVTRNVPKDSIVDILGMAPVGLSRAGFAHTGWSWEKDKAGTRITSPAIITADTTVYALWAPTVLSDTPNIDPITAGDRLVTGQGVPGAEIEVTWPNGGKTRVIVRGSGNWAANVPAGVALVEGDIVEAVQTEPGKLPSDPATEAVGGKLGGKSDTPDINTIYAGDETITGRGVSGSHIDVKFPDDTVVAATVDALGLWSVAVPQHIALVAGDIVYAQQTTGANSPSDWAKSTVVDKPEHDRSDTPNINPIDEGDMSVTGEGVPGAEIEVTWPDGSKGKTTVGRRGNWSIAVPPGGLKAGDVVTAVQTEPDKEPSWPAHEVVKGVPPKDGESDTPDIDVIYEGDAAISGSGVAGSTIVVRFKDGRTVNTTVRADGKWSVDVLPGIALVAGDIVEALQVTSNYDPSEWAQSTVRARAQPPLISDTPNINPIGAGDKTVTGEGVPGAEVEVSWPGGTEKTRVKVDANGNWTAVVPEGVTLVENNIVTAIQYEPGKEPSDPAHATVGGGYKPGDGKSDTPNIDAIVEGDRTVSGYGVPGSEITVKFMNNEKARTYVLPNGLWSVSVPAGVVLLEGDIVLAVQVTGYKDASDEAQSTVLGAPRPKLSDTPNIDPIKETDEQVTGQGVPGADIVVTWPNGEKSATKVEPDGYWGVDVPDGVALKEGDIITAIQTEPGKPDSLPAHETVNGDKKTGPGNDGKSDTPDIDEIFVGATKVTGRGTPGSEVVVKFKNGQTARVIVGQDGKWSADVPAGLSMSEGDRVFAQQFTDGKAPSDWAQRTVIAHRAPSEKPTVDPVTEGDNAVTGKGKPGAKITVTWPDGTTSSGFVDGGGNWKIDVPGGMALKPGDKISVVQIEMGKGPSEQVDAYVRARGATAPGRVVVGGAGAIGAQPVSVIEAEDEDSPLTGFIVDHIQYIKGYPEGDVRPDAPISRAETAEVIYRLLEASRSGNKYLSPFPDVKASDWYGESVSYLANIKIIRGYPDGTFKPDAPISRAEFATMISGFDKLESVDYNKFPDVEGHWAVGYINSAAEKGWVSGYLDGMFRPEEFITRAEVISVINRMLNRKLLAADIVDWAPSYTDLTDEHWAYADVIEASMGHKYERKPDGFEIWTERLR